MEVERISGVIERTLWVLIGAAVGAMVGFVAGRARLCPIPGCPMRARRIVSIVGWSVFGAAVAGYWVTR